MSPGENLVVEKALCVLHCARFYSVSVKAFLFELRVMCFNNDWLSREEREAQSDGVGFTVTSQLVVSQAYRSCLYLLSPPQETTEALFDVLFVTL